MRRKSKISVPNGFLAAIVMLIFVSGIATMLVSGHKLSEITQNKNVSEPLNNSSGNTLEGINSRAVSPNAFEEESNLPNGYRLVSVLNEEIYKGSLVLVNYQHESRIDGENLVNIYENISSSVGVKEDNMMINSVVLDNMNVFFDAFKEAKGKTSILISSSYRSKNDQQKIYDDSVKETGKKSTAYYVAVPGFSEHQTGYCFDTAAINKDNEMVVLDGEGDFSWLSENCNDYGFILRYPNDKTNITGIGYESWHFRYVGKAHSLFMTKHNLCLEEPYNVSGDNIGGFIVTVDVSKNSSAIPDNATSEWSFDNSDLIIKDFVDYDPYNDTEEDEDEEDTERDSDRNRSGKKSNNDDWENDSFWDDEDDSESSDKSQNDSEFEYVDYYDDYDENYKTDEENDYSDNGEDYEE